MLLVLALATFAFSEIMYDWPGSDTNHEWVELVNCSAGAVEIADEFRFFDGDPHLITGPIRGTRSIPSGGVFILAADAKTATSTFFADYPNFSSTIFDTVMRLTNTSDTLELRGEAGMVLASVTYQSAWGGQGSGKSIEKENPCDGNPNSGWRESTAVGGTPGSALLQITFTPTPVPSPAATPAAPPASPPTATPETDGGLTSVSYPASAPTSTPAPASTSRPSSSPTPTLTPVSVPTPSVAAPLATQPSSSPTPFFSSSPAASQPPPPIINEVLPSPAGPDTQNEFIELLNPNESPFDLSGWFLDDGEGGSASYQLPAGTVIQPRGVFVFSSAATKIALNNDGDSVRLLDAGKAVLESIAYSKAEEGRAYARGEDGTWRWTNLPTPGSQNVFAEKQITETKKSKTAASPSTPAAKEGETSEPSPTPFVLDLTKLSPKESLGARIVSSDTRTLVLAGSVAVSLSLLLVFARRFF